LSQLGKKNALTCSDRVFSGEQGCPRRSAGRLGVMLAQDSPIVGQSVDVGSLQVGIASEPNVVPTLKLVTPVFSAHSAIYFIHYRLFF